MTDDNSKMNYFFRSGYRNLLNVFIGSFSNIRQKAVGNREYYTNKKGKEKVKSGAIQWVSRVWGALQHHKLLRIFAEIAVAPFSVVVMLSIFIVGGIATLMFCLAHAVILLPVGLVFGIVNTISPKINKS